MPLAVEKTVLRPVSEALVVSTKVSCCLGSLSMDGLADACLSASKACCCVASH